MPYPYKELIISLLKEWLNEVVTSSGGWKLNLGLEQKYHDKGNKQVTLKKLILPYFLV